MHDKVLQFRLRQSPAHCTNNLCWDHYIGADQPPQRIEFSRCIKCSRHHSEHIQVRQSNLDARIALEMFFQGRSRLPWTCDKISCPNQITIHAFQPWSPKCSAIVATCACLRIQLTKSNLTANEFTIQAADLVRLEIQSWPNKYSHQIVHTMHTTAKQKKW